jgi:uncharacterized protein YfdQ (DUF2303 family)
MDASLINAIGALALSANDANKLATPTPAIVLGNTVVSLENLQDGRSRFRGGLKTNSLADFVAYVKRDHGIDKALQPQTYIDASNLSASAFFNLGNHQNPGHADHTAQLKLEQTAAYRAVMAADGKRIDQKALAEWLEEWGAQLTVWGVDEQIPVSFAINAIRSVTVKAVAESKTTVGNFSQARTAMEDIEAKASGLTSLPHRIEFRFTPALGLSEQSADLRLSLIANPEEKPTFALRWIGREQVVEAIAQDFKRVLFEEIGESALLTIGTFTP